MVQQPGERGYADGHRRWPGLTTVYARMPPHDTETVTGRGQIGVAFSNHREVAYASDGTPRSASYPGGSIICSGDAEIVWSRVRDHTEALEIYPDPALLVQTGGGAVDAQRPWPVDRSRVGVIDPVVLAVASVLRRGHLIECSVSDIAASTLAHLLARHVLREYAGVAVDHEPGHTRLPPATLRRVHDRIEACLGDVITLDELAAEAHLSTFHFARAFKASVGVAPHSFVTSRRMDRARQLLVQSGVTVEQVAIKVGFGNLSHFRRVFRAHVGTTPVEYRRLSIIY